jgi:phosphoglycolate phosphatase
MAARAAIFDLDGTILDTIPDLAGSLNSALAEFGLPEIPAEKIQAMVGNGITVLVERALPPANRRPETITEVRSLFKSVYQERQLEKTRPFPGIGELLAQLRAKGWPLGILSNKDHQNAVLIAEHFFPGLFDAVTGLAPGLSPKPDCNGALETARRLGSEPSNIYYFGDSDVDMITAKNCGFIAIGAGWGYRSQEELKAAGARIVLERPQDFINFLAGQESRDSRDQSDAFRKVMKAKALDRG